MTSALPPTTSAPLRVLVADDNRDAADSLAKILGLLGYEVKVAYDGADAVDAAQRFSPHVALLDIGMPKVDGYAAAGKIRALPGGASMLLVAITGWGQESDRSRASAAGFDRHMTKPVEIAELEAVLAARRG